MRKPTVTTIRLTTGLDLGDRTTHACSLDEKRRVVERTEFPTTRSAYIREFAGKPCRHIVLEAGSQSLWISHLLLELGHDVTVVDPRRVKLIAESNRKTDRRDAEMLARLALGVPELLGRAQHRTFAMQSHVAMLRSRDLLVRTRTKWVTHVRSTLKAFGVKVPTCSAPCFYQRAAEHIPEPLVPTLRPILESLEHIERQIRSFDKAVEKLGEKEYPDTKLLRQVRGVGPLLSLAFVVSLGQPHRFQRSRSVASWVGLVPKKRSSGDGDPQLRITKQGDSYLRRLLVTSAHYILGPFGEDSDLRRHGLKLCRHGAGNAKKRAVVAVARRLAVLLHRLWVSRATYEPLRNSQSDAAA